METNYAIELYSLRDITENSMRLALQKSAEMGYTGAEFAGFYDYTAEQIKLWCDKFGLTPVATHTGLGALDAANIDATVKYHKTLGCTQIVVPGADWSTAEKMEANIAALNAAQKQLAACGIRLGYHNHSHEFLKTAYGKYIFEELAARTDLLFEVDTFWTYNAGVDTIPFLEKNKDRVFLIHLKDGIPTDALNRNIKDCYNGVAGKAIGEGTAPVADVIAWSNANRIPMIVESEGLQPTGLDEVGRSIEWLKNN